MTEEKLTKKDRVPALPIGPDFPWLAPLAGFSDLPFRMLCREQGAAVACTEMVSAKGLIYGLRQKARQKNRTEELLASAPEDAPLVVQLFAEDAEFIGAAVEELQQRGFIYFDLNMGCSVPKVTKTGAGAALLRDPAQALAAASTLLKKAGPGRAGCKIRLGWDSAAPVYLELAKGLADAGAAWITLHPRYARQGFSGSADIAALEKLVKAVDVPILASGDLFTAEDGLQRLEAGVGGVMFARGAMNNPAVFKRYLALRQGEEFPAILSARDLWTLILRHAELARALTPGEPGRKAHAPALLKMRTVVPRYVRHLPGVKHLRRALAHCGDWDDLQVILRDYFSEWAQGAEE
jgi:tRNA-dihydrouridine synthase B